MREKVQKIGKEGSRATTQPEGTAGFCPVESSIVLNVSELLGEGF